MGQNFTFVRYVISRQHYIYYHPMDIFSFQKQSAVFNICFKSLASTACERGSNKIPAYKHTKMTNEIPDNTVCPDGSTCVAKRSCCPLATGQYGCCPYSYATCCSDKVHCCPDGYTCKRGKIDYTFAINCVLVR